MDVDTLRRVQAGDEDALQELARWLDRLSEEDKAHLAELGSQGSDEVVEDADRFWADLGPLKTVVDSVPASVGEALADMETRARRLGTCERIQVMGLRSYQRRLLGDSELAERLLHEAMDLAPACRLTHQDPGITACLLDLWRRLAILEVALGRPEKGLRMAQGALDGYEVFGGPGHDIDGDGIASCHYARGVIRGSLGDHPGAAGDFSVCLDRFPPESAVWDRALGDFTTALARCDRASREKAWQLQERRRLRMGHRSGTTEYAYFFWTDGQLAANLGKQRARKKMKLALDEFAKQRMPDQVIGVGHDIALSLWPNRDRIKGFFRWELTPLLKGLTLGRRQVEALNEVVALLRGCPQPETLSLLVPALHRLREAAGAHLPPCLIVP